MKRPILLSIISLLFFTAKLTFAQGDSSSAFEMATLNYNSVPVTATLFVNEYPSKKEQFTDDWGIGSIYFIDGTKAENCNLRYNCWKDELIWLRNTDFKTGTVIKSSVKEFSINSNNRTKTFTKVLDDKILSKQEIYIEVLSEGNISFYCHRKVSYIKSSAAFTEKHQYYLKLDENLVKIKLRKSELLKFFTEDQQKSLKAILRENHLKFKDEYQLAKGFDIYNAKIISQNTLEQ